MRGIALLCSAALLAATPTPAFAQATDAHAGHGSHAGAAAQLQAAPPEPASEGDVMPDHNPGSGTLPAPPPPDDHAADAYFDPAEMARAREVLRQENGAFSGSMVLFDLAELQVRDGRDGYRWEGEAWFGGDIDRLLVKTEGAGDLGERIGDVEVQGLWSHAITPFFNAHLGIRHDIVPNPSRTYAVLGVEGFAPYWLHVSGQMFLSDKGALHARLEASYDERITQRLIFQPRTEINFSAQDVPEIGVGSGLSEFELGARLRYEIRREFAPYLGVEWAKRIGDTADFARVAGEDADTINLMLGARAWF